MVWKARADLERRKDVLAGELAGLREVKGRLERDVALLRPESLDPDMLDERARAILNLAHQDDLIMMKRRQPVPDPPAAIIAQALDAQAFGRTSRSC